MTQGRPVVRIVSAELQQAGRYLITQRLPKAVLPLLWEFPGGRVREGESDAEALVRAVKARIGVTVQPRERVLEVSHAYEGYTVILSVYRCTIEGDEDPWAESVAALAWVLPEEFSRYPFPGADQQTIDLLLAE